MITTINEFKKYLTINEVGEANIDTYDYVIDKQHHIYSGRFLTNTGFNYVVELRVVENEMYINFMTIEEGDNETDSNDVYKVMSTIIAIIKEVINKEPQIDLIYFTSKEKINSNTNQRQKLYLAYAKKHLGPEWNSYNDGNQTMLTKKKLFPFGLKENLEEIDFDRYEIDAFVNIVTDPEKISLYESRAKNIKSTDLSFKTVDRNDILYLTVMLKPRNSSVANKMGEIGVVRVRVIDTFYGLNKLKQLSHSDKII